MACLVLDLISLFATQASLKKQYCSQMESTDDRRRQLSDSLEEELHQQHYNFGFSMQETRKTGGMKHWLNKFVPQTLIK